jgi:hypothetical protein
MRRAFLRSETTSSSRLDRLQGWAGLTPVGAASPDRAVVSHDQVRFSHVPIAPPSFCPSGYKGMDGAPVTAGALFPGSWEDLLRAMAIPSSTTAALIHLVILDFIFCELGPGSDSGLTDRRRALCQGLYRRLGNVAAGGIVDGLKIIRPDEVGHQALGVDHRTGLRGTETRVGIGTLRRP